MMGSSAKAAMWMVTIPGMSAGVAGRSSKAMMGRMGDPMVDTRNQGLEAWLISIATDKK